ncbi:MAG: MFS transporter [Alphaproteobacteria bacterium]
MTETTPRPIASSIYTDPCRSEAIAAAPPCAPSRAGPFVLAAAILASAMAFIDGTVVNVALPIIQRDLGASAIGLQWIVESYALFLAALLLTAGAMGDRFGRRLVFAVGVGIFAAASLWCGLAASVPELIGARAAQGIGAALLVPGSLALIGAHFPKETRGRAIGTWSAATALTMALGPVLGGWLAENVSWRWIFFINLPVAAVALAITLTRVPESRNENDTAPPDWIGAALATFGLGALVFGLIEAGRLGLGDPLVAAGLTAGVAGLAGFWLHQLRSSHPMIPPGLFGSGTFTGANLMTLLLYAALGGALFFLPLYLIQVRGYTATGAAAAFLPFVVIMAAASRRSGALADRLGVRLPLIAGPAVTAAGFGLLAAPGLGTGYWTEIFPAIAVLGGGMALTVAPLTTAVMSSVPDGREGTASGINNAASRVAALLAIAVFGLIAVTLAEGQLRAQLSEMLPAEFAGDVTRMTFAFGAVELPPDLDREFGDTVRALAKRNFAEAYRVIMWLAALISLAASALAWLLVRPEGEARE